MTERAVKRVGGVGNMQLGMSLVREEMREICFQTSIRCTDAPMGVKPSASHGIGSTLFQKFLPSFVPINEFRSKCLFTRFSKRKGKMAQFFARLRLGPPGQIPVHGSDLVELAELYWHVRKNLFYTAFSVDNHCVNGIAEYLDEFPPLAICLGGFRCKFRAVEILFELRRTKDDDTVAPAPERDIGNDDHWLAHELHAAIWNLIQLFANP